MIKLLQDLLTEATCNPNVPGSLVAGLRKAVDAARAEASPWPQEADPSVVLPPSFDSLEEAQRAAGVVQPQVATDPPYRVCIKAHETNVGNTVPVGHVVTGGLMQQPDCWAPCDKDGWVSCDPPFGTRRESKFGLEGVKVWRPLADDALPEHSGSRGQPPFAFSTGHTDAIPKPSAIDEMAEQMKRWAAPTREDACDPESCGACQLASRQSLAQDTAPVAWFDKDGKIQGRVSDEQLDAILREALADLDKRNGWEEQRKAHEETWSHLPESVMSEEEIATFHGRTGVLDAKPTNPKDAAATDRVPLGLLSPIAKAHWALAQHCGRAKYGAWNWREAGVRASIYIDAIGRHTDGYLSGETYDPADGTHHLGNIMACCAILLEAEAAGKLNDDRPPTLDMRPTYAEVQRRLADLTTKYVDRNPKHWTR